MSAAQPLERADAAGRPSEERDYSVFDAELSGQAFSLRLLT